MQCTYLFVPPEERAEVEALGGQWDSAKKRWFVEGAPSSRLSRWSSIVEDDEYSVISNDAYVVSTSILCPHCAHETEVIAIYCVSGTVLDEPLERFTISDIRAIDEVLLQGLKRWPRFRATTERDGFGDFANHCEACGDVIGDIDLHSEPGHAFIDIAHAVEGTVTLFALARAVRLSGNEHFVVD
jgi:hypothetical protein